MKKLIFSLLTACITLSVFAQPGAGRAQSKVETKTFHSKVLNADRDYTIYLPKSFEVEKDRKYPILYLLHGVWDTNLGWFERRHTKDVMDQLVASGEVCEMIVVSPNAGGPANADAWNGYFDMPGWKYETFFFTEFLPYIESTYRVMGDKGHRAIAGLSMGGGGATKYGQYHSDMFSSVYAMSALMDLPQTGGVASRTAGDKTSLLNESVIANSCVKYVKEANDARKAQLRSVVWFVDCGDDDFLLDRNIEFFQAMRDAQIPLQFRVRDGGHTQEYWHSALYMCLPYVTRNFAK